MMKEEELGKIEIEISVLTIPKKLKYKTPNELLEKLRPNIDGVVLSYGGRGATFLPQVWEEIPKKEGFLSHLCAKAWLDRNQWKEKGCEISVYQVEAFKE